MNSTLLTLRSAIHTDLMQSALFKGTLLASLGVAFLLLSGAFLPPASLKIWGIPIFLIGITLITCGLLPYKRLKRLETNPFKIIVDNDHILHFFAKGNVVFSTPLTNIAQIDYSEKTSIYGICITLKTPLPTKKSCNLFLPYFSKRSCQELQNVILSETL